MSDERKYYLWGFGKEAQKCNKEFLEKIDGIIDQNSELYGKIFYNKVIERPEQVLGRKDVFFIVVIKYGYDEVKRILIDNGYSEGDDFIWGPYWYGNKKIPETYCVNEWKSYDGRLNFNEDKWIKRARIAVNMTPKYKSVADMGAGAMSIKKLLQRGTKYYPIDYTKRFDETIVCDFNKGEYPDLSVDVTYALGVLEYIIDAKRFVNEVCRMAKTVIISYNCIEKCSDFMYRQGAGYKNHFKMIEIIKLFSECNFELKDEQLYDGIGIIFRFQKI